MSRPTFLAPVPDNLRAKKHQYVTSDVYGICDRIKQIDRSLFVVLQEEHAKPWVIVEHCADGIERFVKRYEHLDASILEDLRYMLAIPFDKRVERISKEAEAENDRLTAIDEEKHERFLWDWKDSAVRSNIMDPMWFSSYRKVNAKGAPEKKPDGGKDGERDVP